LVIDLFNTVTYTTMINILKSSTLLFFVTLLSLLVLVFPKTTNAADPFDITTIRGQIMGPDNKPLKLANITVTCDGQTKHTITGANGKYVVIFFGKNVCAAGDTVTVTASKDGNSGSGTGTVDLKRDGRFVDVNFSTLSFSVPEFGTLPGAVALISATGIYFALRRKNKFVL